ncbi:MAG: peptidase T [Bacteroidetes bacterium]|nr:peptidase T [Bacteroidota bacterium]
MFDNYSFTVTDRFLRYVRIDTQSDPHATQFPSTEKQLELSKLLVKELQEMGIIDAALDQFGYVMATIPSTTSKKVPVICFCAHVDTAPDCPGAAVKPILHQHYQGQDLILPDDPSQVIRISNYPYLASKLGQDIITASGTTLLGADNKAGVAIIMDLANFLINNSTIEHGPIRLLFTPDEEVGRGTEKLDIKKLGADFGYTLDGGDLGSLEDETFSANAVKITFFGVVAHPGEAKGKLVNATKLAGSFLTLLPSTTLSPETTAGREGFVHPTEICGIADQCFVELLIRDFETAALATKEQLLKELAQKVCAAHPGSRFSMKVKEQYRNMKEVLVEHPHVIQLARSAMEAAGVQVKTIGVRGGTDGSRLSFMGLPCPNIFAGEQAVHSRHEFVCVQDMQKSVETLVHLVRLAAI